MSFLCFSRRLDRLFVPDSHMPAYELNPACLFAPTLDHTSHVPPLSFRLGHKYAPEVPNVPPSSNYGEIGSGRQVTPLSATLSPYMSLQLAMVLVNHRVPFRPFEVRQYFPVIDAEYPPMIPPPQSESFYTLQDLPIPRQPRPSPARPPAWESRVERLLWFKTPGMTEWHIIFLAQIIGRPPPRAAQRVYKDELMNEGSRNLLGNRGDWDCIECGATNWERRQACVFCYPLDISNLWSAWNDIRRGHQRSSSAIYKPPTLDDMLEYALMLRDFDKLVFLPPHVVHIFYTIRDWVEYDFGREMDGQGWERVTRETRARINFRSRELKRQARAMVQAHMGGQFYNPSSTASLSTHAMVVNYAPPALGTACAQLLTIRPFTEEIISLRTKVSHNHAEQDPEETGDSEPIMTDAFLKRHRAFVDSGWGGARGKSGSENSESSSTCPSMKCPPLTRSQTRTVTPIATPESIGTAVEVAPTYVPMPTPLLTPPRARRRDVAERAYAQGQQGYNWPILMHPRPMAPLQDWVWEM